MRIPLLLVCFAACNGTGSVKIDEADTSTAAADTDADTDTSPLADTDTSETAALTDTAPPIDTGLPSDTTDTGAGLCPPAGVVTSSFDGYFQTFPALTGLGPVAFQLEGDGWACSVECDDGISNLWISDDNCLNPPVLWPVDVTVPTRPLLCWTIPPVGVGDTGRCRVETSNGWLVADWEAI